VSAKSSEESLSDIRATPSLELEKSQTLSAESASTSVPHFLLPWSAYVRLLSVQNEHAHRLYETEALRGGWSVRQLDRQIDSQFYERTALARDKAAPVNHESRGVALDTPPFLFLRNTPIRTPIQEQRIQAMKRTLCTPISVSVLAKDPAPKSRQYRMFTM
jgi:hypothetical protein